MLAGQWLAENCQYGLRYMLLNDRGRNCYRDSLRRQESLKSGNYREKVESQRMRVYSRERNKKTTVRLAD